MQVHLLKSKIHRAQVTGASLDYEGSLTIAEDLMEKVGLLPHERILCSNLANGQRFETYADLDRHKCTIEEREEYEPHLDRGTIVYAGVDYAEILAAAEKEADVIVWDGGNNDFSFVKADLQIVVADPHRPGHERTYHPGETNVRLADVVVINKITTTDYENVEAVRRSVEELNPRAIVVDAASPITVDHPEWIRGPGSSGA